MAEEKQQTSVKHGTALEVVQKDLEKLRMVELDDKGTMKQRRAILICVDSSQNSVRAVEWASVHVLKKDDIVILATVWEELIDISGSTESIEIGIETLGKLILPYICFLLCAKRFCVRQPVFKKSSPVSFLRPLSPSPAHKTRNKNHIIPQA